MNYNAGDILNFDNQDWIVLFKIDKNKKEYWFVNALDLETEEFYQDYCFIDNYGSKVTDEVIISELIPLMKEKLNSATERG